MKKLSTHIKGLDTLFHGGLQVTSVTDQGYCNHPGNSIDHRLRDSLVIVIRGCRGCHKHLFAMQLMHGLGKSILEYLQNDKHASQSSPQQSGTGDSQNYDFKGLRYYSINKQDHLLEDMYLDLLIERWISHTNIEYKEILLGKGNYDQKCKEINRLNQRNLDICETLFDWDSVQHLYHEDIAVLEQNLTYYLSNNIIGYNARTNSLHWRSGREPDDENNMLMRRKIIDFDTFFDNQKLAYYTTEHFPHEWSNKHSSECFCNANNSTSKDYYGFENEFLKVSFKSKEDNTLVRNASSARNNFFSILHEIEDMVDNEDDNSNSKKYQREVIVIEGFSHISESDLQSLPYTHLLSCLRKVARISILVFEDTQTTMPDGDIEIEIKSNFDKDEEYTYNELRVSKSVNQVAASGWHLYKRQESHIRIYPSLHLRLFKRSYINNQMHEIGRPIFEDSYDRYLDFPEAIVNNLVPTNPTNPEASSYERSKESENKTPTHNLHGRAEKYKAFSLEDTKGYETCNCDYRNHIYNYLTHRIKNDNNPLENWSYEALSKIITGKWSENHFHKVGNNCIDGPLRLHNHPPVTTIVGNPNSFKRSLALCQGFAHKKSNVDGNVLIVLLDKDSDEMRKKIICPALRGRVKTNPKSDMSKCLNCYKKITFLNVNPGCITPEELLSMLKDHIKVYIGEYKKLDKKRPLHIIFDDYHRIDFNFPFLSSSTLFTSALISLCQSYEVGLTILCDKNSKRVREVCTLSDYVICVERNEADVRRLSIYLERMGDLADSASVLRYDISDLPIEMECGKNGLQITEDFYRKNVKVAQLGSMKEYWRKTVNTVDRNRPRDENHKSHKKRNKKH